MVMARRLIPGGLGIQVLRQFHSFMQYAVVPADHWRKEGGIAEARSALHHGATTRLLYTPSHLTRAASSNPTHLWRESGSRKTGVR